MAKRHGCLFSFLAFVLVVVLVVVVGALWLLSSTPRQLNMAGTYIGNNTVEQLGVADVTFNQMLQLAKSITTQHQQSTIAPKAYTSQQGEAADEKFRNTLIGGSTVQYKNLLYTPAQTSANLFAQPITLQFGEIAYAVDSALHQFYVSTEKDLVDAMGVEAVNVLESLDASVVQIDLLQQQSDILLETVVRLDVSQYVEQLNTQLPFGITIADTIFCTVTSKISVDEDGKIVDEGFVSIAINDQPEQLSLTALNALFMFIAQEGEEPLTAQQVSQYIGIVMRILWGNMGSIGMEEGLSATYGSLGIDFQNATVNFLPTAIF